MDRRLALNRPPLGHVLLEVLRGKNLSRILLMGALKHLFKINPVLQESHSVLEIGYAPSSHHRVYPAAWKVEGANYVAGSGVTHVFDANQAFPISDGAFDGVVFMNVLPVIRNDDTLISEAVRCARKFVLFNVPLISGIARHPADYHRYTQDRLEALLEEQQVLSRSHVFRVGASFTSAWSLIDPLLKWRLIRLLAYPAAILLDAADRTRDRECPMHYMCLILK